MASSRAMVSGLSYWVLRVNQWMSWNMSGRNSCSATWTNHSNEAYWLPFTQKNICESCNPIIFDEQWMALKKERCGQYGSSYLLNQFLLQSECTRQIYLLIYYNNRFVQNRTQSYITHTHKQTNKHIHQNELTLSTSHPNSSRKGKSFLYRLVMGLWMGRGKQQQQQQQCIRIEHTTTYYPRHT